MKKTKTKAWSKLDNAAKIFPPTTDKRNTKVFRFACTLKENIDPLVLQKALEETMLLFPFYRFILKKGFFWYYLEQTDLKPMVVLESKAPCSPLYLKGEESLLFEVSYFKKRINLEVFHALTDGNGALQFLKTLVNYYLYFNNPQDIKDLPQLEETTIHQKADDSFQKYYDDKSDTKKEKGKKAFLLKGLKYPESRMRIMEATLSTKQALTLAKSYQASLTVLLSAVLMQAICKERPYRKRKQPIVLTIPVNLRNYFDSKTARNFFGIFNVGYPFSKKVESLEEITASLKTSFDTELTVSKLAVRMNSFAKLEHNILARAIPLFLKDIILKVGDFFSKKQYTMAFSNLGKIEMPKETTAYIESFDVFISTDSIQLCICSFEDTLTLSFSTVFLNKDIPREFFRSLSQLGLELTITTNPVEED